MTYIRIEPERTPGGEGRYECRMPAESLVVGAKMRLQVNCGGEGTTRIKRNCTVQEINRAHRWIRVSYHAGDKILNECMKFVEES